MRKKSAIVAFALCILAPLFFSHARASDSARSSEANALIQEIESAKDKIVKDFGWKVFTDRPTELDTLAGRTRTRDVWNRYLSNEGFPQGDAARLAVCKRLNLDPRASLVLVSGTPDEDKINHLLDALRQIANEH